MARRKPNHEAELKLALAAVRSRGEIKALGERLDAEPGLHAAAVRLAVAAGHPPETDGRRLVRLLLNRAEGAQERFNPVRVDEAYTCGHCGAEVEAGGAHVRDHCPRCLRSKHVDVVPGDRANPCQGLLDPAGFVLEARAGVVILYRCRRCGQRLRCSAHADDAIPVSVPAEILRPAEWMPAPPWLSAQAPDPARTLPARVLDAVRRAALWEPGQRVLVAVSGGVDSTALLHLLARTAGAHGGRLEAMSLDHGLRPEAADEVAAVRAQAEDLELPFHTAALKLVPGPNLAARAREARRAALLAVGADRIATGHQQDDQAETVLYHLLRGSGLTGLRGMAPLDAPWCRPLLGEPREVIARWAADQGLRWVEDPSNPGSQRGALRQIFPALDAIQGGAREALARTARLLSRDDALLDQLTTEAWPRVARDGGLDRARLSAEHPALQLRLLRRLVAQVPHPIRADRLEAVLTGAPPEGGMLELGGHHTLRASAGRIYVHGPDGAPRPSRKG